MSLSYASYLKHSSDYAYIKIKDMDTDLSERIDEQPLLLDPDSRNDANSVLSEVGYNRTKITLSGFTEATHIAMLNTFRKNGYYAELYIEKNGVAIVNTGYWAINRFTHKLITGTIYYDFNLELIKVYETT
jgi:hypothetical protein